MSRIVSLFSRHRGVPSERRLPVAERTVYKGFLSLTDQGIASATNFLTTVIVGKFAGIDALGVYALAFTLMVLLSGIQDSLVGQPYVVFGNRRRGKGANFTAGNALAHTLLLGAIAMIAFAGAAGATTFVGQTNHLSRVLFVLAIVAPLLLIRDLSRRMAFAHLRIETALAVDLAICILQIGGLSLLAWNGMLNAAWAQLTVGLSCGITGLAWFLSHRRQFVIQAKYARHAARRSWKFGRWLLASQSTFIMNAYFVHWLLMFVMDAAATGAYAACMTIVMLSNPIIIGIGNFLGPKAARSFLEGGAPKLRALTIKSTLLFVVMMGSFAATLWLAGGWLLGAFYGNEFAEYRYLIRVLTGVMFFNAIGVPSACALLAMQRTDVSFRASLVGGITTMVMSILLIGPFGMIGAACGSVAGSFAGSLVSIGSVWWLTTSGVGAGASTVELTSSVASRSPVVSSPPSVEVTSV